MMEYKGYLGKIEFDDEADIFHGEVVNIRDVITFQGHSVSELRHAFEDSIEDYLEFFGSSGIQGVDKKKRVRPSKSSQRR